MQLYSLRALETGESGQTYNRVMQMWYYSITLTHSSSSHTHTHTFNGTFSGTTGVCQYQKGKTNLDFTEARDSEWQWHQLGHMQVCTSLQIDNHASTPPLSFYRPDALPAAQPALKDIAIMDISAHSSLCEFYLLLKSYFCCCCHFVTVDCSRVFSYCTAL